jgi:hypothetical protein
MAEIIPASRSTTLSEAQQTALAFSILQIDQDRALAIETAAAPFGEAALNLYAEEINALRDPGRYEHRLAQARTLA